MGGICVRASRRRRERVSSSDHHPPPPAHHNGTTELKSDGEIAEQAGGNLFTDTPEIRSWLLGVEKGKELVVGGAYVRALGGKVEEGWEGRRVVVRCCGWVAGERRWSMI